MKVRNGGTITLSVIAECYPGETVYRWFKNQKNPLEGQASSSLLIHKAKTEDTGQLHWEAVYLVNHFKFELDIKMSREVLSLFNTNYGVGVFIR